MHVQLEFFVATGGDFNQEHKQITGRDTHRQTFPPRVSWR